jgi:DNA-binding Xre family transcriptional regulator
MVKLRVREIAEKKGIRNPRVLSQKSGVAYATCYGLWYGQRTLIGLGVIDKLCKALGVTPGRLFDYDPRDGSARL